MTAPTLKRATDTSTDGSNVKYGAPDIVEIVQVLEGDHPSGEKVQVQNIESVTAPWHYYIYKVGTTTYARRGDTHNAQYSGTNSHTVVNNAINQAYTDYSRAYIMFAPGTYDFQNNVISIASRSNLTIKGSGMYQTTIQNGGFAKNSDTNTSNCHWEDLTIDANLQTAVGCPLHLSAGATTASTNFRIIRVRVMNSRDATLVNWSYVDHLVVEDSVFINGGSGGTIAADNCLGGQLRPGTGGGAHRSTVWSNCYFEKDSTSLGGGMVTSGSSGNLVFTGCVFYNSGTSSNSYNAISVENVFGVCEEIIVSNCRGAGPSMGVSIGNSPSVQIQRAVVTNCQMTHGINIQGAKDAIIANCEVLNSIIYGYAMVNCNRAHVSNCIARNTNIGLGSPNYDKGGLYAVDNGYLMVDKLTVVDDQGSPTIAYGALIGQSTGGTNRVHLVDCNFIGPFSVISLEIQNTLDVVVRGGRVASAPQFANGSFPNTNVTVSFLEGYAGNIFADKPTHALAKAFISSSDPTTTTIPDGYFALAENTTNKLTKLFYNDSGTLKTFTSSDVSFDPELIRRGGYFGGVMTAGATITSGWLEGFLSGYTQATVTGTASYISDANGKYLRLLSAGTSGSDAGFNVNTDATTNPIIAVRADQNPRLKIKWRMGNSALSSNASVRAYIGFITTTGGLLTGDTPWATGVEHVALLLKGGGSNYLISHNNNAGAAVEVDTAVARGTAINTLELKTTDGGTTWFWNLNGTTNSFNADNPAATVALYPHIQVETSEAVAKVIEVWYWLLETSA